MYEHNYHLTLIRCWLIPVAVVAAVADAVQASASVFAVAGWRERWSSLEVVDRLLVRSLVLVTCVRYH